MKLIQRLGLVLGVTLYILAFNISYIELVAPAYANVGLDYSPIDPGFALMTWLLCLVPALWLPADIRRPSMILFLTQYLFIYIPASFILYYSSKPVFDGPTVLELQVVMLIGLSIMQAVYYVPLASVKCRPMPQKEFFIILAIMIILPLAYLGVTLGRNFRLTAFITDNENSLFRLDQANDINAGSLSSIGLYGEFWIANVIFPLLAAIGFFCKRRSLLVIIVIGYTLVFGLSAFRSHLLAPVFIIAVYGWTRLRHKYLALFAGLCMAFLWPLALTGDRFETIRDWWVVMWHMRTVSVQGLSFGQYFEFFQQNPITHFTHLNVFNILKISPYSNLPYAVSEYFYGVRTGANANFWAADGLSSLGLIGVPVMSVFCSAFFWLLDSVAVRYRCNFVLVCLAFMPVSFGNVSLFTDLLSGGFGLLLLVLYFGPSTGLMRNALRPVAETSIVPVPSGYRFARSKPRFPRAADKLSKPRDPYVRNLRFL